MVRRTEARVFAADPQAIRQAIAETLHAEGVQNAGWAPDGSQAYGTFGMSLLSWGERVTVFVQAGGQVQVVSETVMPLQLIDYGRNSANCRKILDGISARLGVAGVPVGAPVGGVAQVAPAGAVPQVAPAQPAAQPATPAGWYPDPNGGGGQRYWDGSAWTGHVSA